MPSTLRLMLHVPVASTLLTLVEATSDLTAAHVDTFDSLRYHQRMSSPHYLSAAIKVDKSILIARRLTSINSGNQ
jgi:hypothetical protein